MSEQEQMVSMDVLTAHTVAGARAFWALKDLEAAHEALRVEVMVIASDPHLTWEVARERLMAVLVAVRSNAGNGHGAGLTDSLSTPSPAWEQVDKLIADWVWPSPINTLKELLDAARAADASQIADLKARLRDAELIRDRNAEDCENGVELLRASQARVTALSAQVNERTKMHDELARIAGSAIVLATLDSRAGERPATEPDHALPEAVWRLVQERDAARARVEALEQEKADRLDNSGLVSECCMVPVEPEERFCPKCGWETRVQLRQQLTEKEKAVKASRDTLKAALQKARGYVVERLEQGNHYDGPPRPGFVDYDLMMIDAALAACVPSQEK